MEKTPEKHESPLNTSNSLNKSNSLSKQCSFSNEKSFIIYKSPNITPNSRKHAHNKAKCVICQTKEAQKQLQKKKPELKASKPIAESLKNIEEEPLPPKTPEHPDLVMKTIRHASLNFLFDPFRDEYPNKPYHIDGDPKMYTPEILEIRNSLKSDPIVKKSINNFMVLYQFDSNGLLSKKGYIDINYKIIGVLRPELKGEENHDEMKFTLEQDWKHDTKGKERMTKEDVFDSLFELADIWTGGVDNFEYGSFFDMMKMKIILEEQKSKDF